MAETLAELRETLDKNRHDAQEIKRKADAEGRELTNDELATVEKHVTTALDARTKIVALENADRKRQETLDALEGLSDRGDVSGRRIAPGRPGDTSRTGQNFEYTLRGRKKSIAAGTPAYARNVGKGREAWIEWLQRPAAAQSAAEYYSGLQTDINVQGGYLTVPEEMAAGMLKDLDDEVFIRRIATVRTTRAQTLGMRKRTAKASTFAWGGELSAPTEDTSLRFGKRSLTPHYMTGLIKVSTDLLASADPDDVEQIVREEMARDAGELEERAFMTGSGSQRPLGLFTASPDGISTSRDVSTGNTTTSLTFDGLINALFGLKSSYQSRATWLFSRTAILQIATLKDGNGQYLWQPSRQMGGPDAILGRPFVMSEWVPATMTTGQYVGMIGDFKQYVIADSPIVEMQRLVELYAATNEVGFKSRRKTDGAPMVEEAFVRLKLG